LHFVDGSNNSQYVFVAFLDLANKSRNIYLYEFYIEFKTNMPVICKRKYANLQVGLLICVVGIFGFLLERKSNTSMFEGRCREYYSFRKREKERMYHENGESYINRNFTYSSLVTIRVMKPKRLRWTKQ